MDIESFFTKKGIKDLLKDPQGRAKAIAVVGVIILLLAVMVTPHTNATTSVYYFESCLGKWRNVSNAEGEPTLPEEATQEEYNLGNSAVLYSSLDSIFCGELDDSLPSKEELQKVTLKLQIAFSNDPLRNPPKVEENNFESEIILVDDEDTQDTSSTTDEVDDVTASTTEDTTEEDTPIIEDEPIDEENVASTTEESIVIEESSLEEDASEATSTESTTEITESNTASTTEESTSTTTTESATSSNTSSVIGSFFRIRLANAEEVISNEDNASSTEDVVLEDTSSEDENSNSSNNAKSESKDKKPNSNSEDKASNSDDKSDNKNVGIPDNIETGNATSSEKTSSSDEDEASVEEEEVYFLEIFYTLDGGRSLRSIDKISATNWVDKKFEYEIPLGSWDEVRDFQVSLHGIDAVENQPIVYLDSAWIEVEHSGDEPKEEDVKVKGTPADYEKDKLVSLTESNEFTADEELIFEDNNTRDRTCEVNPFSLQIEKGNSGRYEIELSEFGKPYRLISSNAPEGVVLERYFETVFDEPHEYIKVSVAEDTEFKSLTLQVLFQIQERRNVVSSAVCRFNVEIIDPEESVITENEPDNTEQN